MQQTTHTPLRNPFRKSLADSVRLLAAVRPAVLYTCLIVLAVLTLSWLLPGPIGMVSRKYGFASDLLGAWCWALLGSRLLLVQRTLRQQRAPHENIRVLLALALLCVPTVLLPAMLIIVMAGMQPLTLTLLVLVNVAGLLWALSPTAVAVLIVVGVPYGLPYLRVLPEGPQFRILGVLTLAALTYAVWQWRAWLRRDRARYTLASLPWVLRVGDRSGLESFGFEAAALNRAGLLRDADRQDEPGLRLDSRRAAHPVFALRCLLGSPYFEQRPRQARRVRIVTGLLVVGGLLAGHLLHWNPASNGFALVALLPVMLPLLVAGSTIATRRTAWPDYFSEPALLPGLGSRGYAHRRMLHAALGFTTARIAAWGLACMLGALLLGAPMRILMMMLAITAAAFLGSASETLNALARRRSGHGMEFVVTFGWFFAIALVVFTGIFMVLFDTGGGTLDRIVGLALAAAWSLMFAVLALRSLADWRAFRRLSHPFLQR